MAELVFYIESGSRPSLLKTHFRSALRHGSLPPELVIAVRGKTPGVHAASCGTFQWTQGVQALTLLGVQTAQWFREGAHGEQPKLSGHSTSPATSLDYALGKPPRWLIDIFGLSTSGQAMAKRCFLRSNPERKSAGATSVSFNLAFLPAGSIIINVDGREVTEVAALKRLASQLEAQWYDGPNVKLSARSVVNGHSVQLTASPAQWPSPFNRDGIHSFLKTIFYQETQATLARTDIFSKRGFSKILSRVSSCPSFTRLFNGKLEYLNPLAHDLEPSERLGFSPLVDEALYGDDPLRVALPMALPGAMAIFSYLKHIKRYNIEIDYRFIHAIEITRSILQNKFTNPPDVCVLGLAPAGTLLGQGRHTGFDPVMFMPMMTHRVLAPKRSKKKTLHGGHYIFLDSDPSTSAFYFDELVQRREVDRAKIRVDHGDPDDVSQALSSGEEDLRSIIYFPYFHLNERFNDCALIDKPMGEEHLKEFVLFAHQSILSRPNRIRALEIAIRDAWLTMRDETGLLDTVLDTFLNDRSYLQFLSRCAGFEHMAGIKGDSNGVILP